VAENFENHGKNSSKFYEIKKRVQKDFQTLFLLSFFRHCKMAFYRKAQDRGEPKNLGVWEKKSKSLISTGKNKIAKNWRKKFASIS